MIHLQTSIALLVLLAVISPGLSSAQDGPSLPSSEAFNLPPAPEEIKLPPPPEDIGLPPASEFKGLPESGEINLPPAPTLTDKFPGNQVIKIEEQNDPRIAVDQDQMPWRAIGRLQAKGGSCTAALIGPSLLLTAAHCLFGARGVQVPAKDLHFKLGYSEGKFVSDAKGVKIIVADDYDPILNIGTMSKDWAIVELDEAIGTPENILPMQESTPGAGDIAALGGYANDMIENLMADPRCNVLGFMFDVNGLPLIRHNCAATQGVSGAPLLINHGDEWLIGGIEVVGSSNGIGGAAVLHEVREAIAKMPGNPLVE